MKEEANPDHQNVSRPVGTVPAGPIVLFRDLTVTFNGRRLIEKQTLEVSPGTVTVLMGPSGAGKSILADVVFGLKREGRDLDLDGEQGDLSELGALVFQSSGGLDHLTPDENLQLAAPNDPGDRTDHARRIGEVWESLGFGEAKPRWDASRKLSGGQQRKLATMRALTRDRRLLWLDEPAAGLDVRSITGLVAELEKSRGQEVAIVVTTHRVGFAASIADRVLFLDGKGNLEPVRLPPKTQEGSDDGRRRALEVELAPLLKEAEVKKKEEGKEEERKREEENQDATGARPVDSTIRPWSIPAVCARSATAGIQSLLSFVDWPNWAVGRSFLKAGNLTVVKGATFYPLVGAVFAGIFILIFELSLPFLSTGRVIVEFGPTIVLRLSPPFAAILVAARAGSAISAWVGQMTVTRQLDALRVLGIPTGRRVTGPAWVGLALGGPVGTLTFGASLLAVFAVYLLVIEGGGAIELLRGFGSVGNAEALAKTVIYGGLVASVTVAFAEEPKHEQDQVSHSLTQGIVWSTVTVMLAELSFLALRYFFL